MTTHVLGYVAVRAMRPARLIMAVAVLLNGPVPRQKPVVHDRRALTHVSVDGTNLHVR